jgi:hypothetical protein
MESDPELEPDPDPLVRGTDPGIRIRTKMSRIPTLQRNNICEKANFAQETEQQSTGTVHA